MPKRCKCPASAPAWPECCNINALEDPSKIDARPIVAVRQDDREVDTPGGVGVGNLEGGSKGGVALNNIRPILTSIPHQPVERVMSGEVQTSDHKLAKRQAKALASRSMDEAIRTVLGVMRTSKQDKIRLDAAKFLIEMVCGKPKVQIDDDKPKSFGSEGLEDEVLEAILEEDH